MSITKKILLPIISLVALASCDKDDPMNETLFESANITFTYTMSPDMLNYFDYTVVYQDDLGYSESMKLDRSAFVLHNYAENFRYLEKPVSFDITRKNTPAPAEQVDWHTTVDVTVVRTYEDQRTDTVKMSTTNQYNPKPEEFETWATQRYIPLMKHGYTVYIKFDGGVHCSFD